LISGMLAPVVMFMAGVMIALAVNYRTHNNSGSAWKRMRVRR
jgi:Mg2+/citrate symporter